MSSEESNPFHDSNIQQNLKSLSQDVGFEIPVESVPLPSQGKVYPVGHPLNGAKTVDIRAMTAREEDLLTSRALIKNGTAVSKLLQSCMINRTIDTDDLLTGDRNAILIAIRITGYGVEYSAKIDCPDCEESFKNDFTLNDLNIQNLGAEPLQEYTNLFEYILPVSGKTVHFRLMTGRDELEMAQEEKRKKKLGQQIETTVTGRLFRSIISIDGIEDRNKISNMVRYMSAGDSRALRNYIDSIEPCVQMRQSVTCPQCGEISEVEIPLGMSFLWPDADK